MAPQAAITEALSRTAWRSLSSFAQIFLVTYDSSVYVPAAHTTQNDCHLMRNLNGYITKHLAGVLIAVSDLLGVRLAQGFEPGVEVGVRQVTRLNELRVRVRVRVTARVASPSHALDIMVVLVLVVVVICSGILAVSSAELRPAKPCKY